MYELRQAGEETFYLECPAKIGIYQPRPGEVYLVDSGGDKDAGRRVRKLLEERGVVCLGRFQCPGYDTYGPWKLVGGIRKGRPNEHDLRMAEQFIQRMAKEAK